MNAHPRIVHIVPGSGDTFYCQNCLRDRGLIRELRSLGHDAILAPMYLPVLDGGGDLETGTPVFYGAVGVYLAGRFPGFAGAPAWLKRRLDSRRLLAWIARRAGTTRARGLESMTLSVLKGEEGRQKDELRRLVAWLGGEVRPDVVHLSNALLLGLAGPIRRDLGVPLVCTLQDEDTWVDAMAPGAAAEAWRLMAAHAAQVARFVPVSRSYGEFMRPRLEIAPERLCVIPIGIDARGYGEAEPAPDRPAIGYLAKMTESLGLEILADAFAILKERGRVKGLRLRVMGGQTADDRPFLRRLRRKLARRGLEADVEFCAAFDRASRIDFLRSLAVMSVPAPRGEAFGTFILEALAAGVPVVQPALGASPELVAATGGGICYDPPDAPTLAAALEGLLLDPGRAHRLGRAGREVVLREFTVRKMAERMLEVYNQIV